MSSETRGFGYVPDIPSVKDYIADTPAVADLMKQTRSARMLSGVAASASGAAAAPALNPSVDLRQFCSPIEDQGRLGSCTANAAAGLVEYFERRAFGKFVDASRLFIYKTTRDLLGWTGDTGAYLRSAMEALVLFGTPPERYWPYDITKFDIEPSAFLYALGSNYQATKYFRLDPNGAPTTQVLQNIKAYLAAGFPSMFGFPVYDEYMHVPADGKAAFPSAHSTYYGGHANVAVGYDDNINIGGQAGALLVRNSWGTGWGLQGYAWLSYKYVTAGLATDWWSVVDQKWVDTGKF
ncbi:MAG: cysteine protease [Candidatus Angelobacter sp. Gp1-AA117]|nr:MAG: cysteine protease [Candidatus Angelobacter sp. Gp1-AA117]